MACNILLICGSLNQTTMMHKIADNLPEFYCYFSPFFADGLVGLLARFGFLNFTILGGNHLKNTLDYLTSNQLQVDPGGKARAYDAVITCTDTLVQRNINGKRLILVQEGMIEPEGWLYQLVRRLRLPRYLANTATTGLSDVYDIFCVASIGYRNLFVRKGVNPDKIYVTGIPNFDNAGSFSINYFPYRNYVLVLTSCARENFKYDDRLDFLRRSLEIAAGRQLIIKLHPNENFARAIKEINQVAPEAMIFTNGNTNEMIANCAVLVTQYTSATYIGLALGKECYSELDLDDLRQIMPIQNGGVSARRIADHCRELVNTPDAEMAMIRDGYGRKPGRRLADLR